MSKHIKEMIQFLVYEKAFCVDGWHEIECTGLETCIDCYKIYLTGVLS